MKFIERLARSPVAWLLAAGLAVSIVSLVIFFVETGLSDEKLLILHNILRYSSFVVFVCSLYIIIISIYNLISRKSKVIWCIIKIFVSLSLIIWCTGIFYLEAFIQVFSGGTL